MRRVSSFLQQVACRNDFLAGRNESWGQLTTEKQKRILAFWDKRTLLDSSSSRIVAWADSYWQRWRWNRLPSTVKAEVIHRFLEDRVVHKIAKENQAAREQQQQQVSFQEFHRAPFHLSHGFLSKIKTIFAAFFFKTAQPLCIATEKATLPRALGVAHAQGRRPSMEDEHVATQISICTGEVTHTVELYGICDGHGGRSAASFAKEHLAEYIKLALEKHCAHGLTDVGIFAAFKEAFAELDAAYVGDAGSTISLAILLDGHLWGCNLGDSRMVLSHAKEAIQFSEDQKCDNPKYVKGVTDLGGVVIRIRGISRVNGYLAVPRALGDHTIVGKEGGTCCVVPTPKITKIALSSLQPGSRLAIGCDGIWDVCSTDQAIDFFHAHPHASNEDLATGLVHKAYHAGSGDNLSALVISLT